MCGTGSSSFKKPNSEVVHTRGYLPNTRFRTTRLRLYVRQVEFSYQVVNFQQQEVKPGSQQQQEQRVKN
jgi:hypothetical protein